MLYVNYTSLSLSLYTHTNTHTHTHTLYSLTELKWSIQPSKQEWVRKSWQHKMSMSLYKYNLQSTIYEKSSLIYNVIIWIEKGIWVYTRMCWISSDLGRQAGLGLVSTWMGERHLRSVFWDQRTKENYWRPSKNKYTKTGSTNFFHKESERKYFGFCKLYGLDYKYLILPLKYYSIVIATDNM